jgi:thiopurine S-methyltransferase
MSNRQVDTVERAGPVCGDSRERGTRGGVRSAARRLLDMTPDFWNDRWATRNIGFHEGAPNEMLVAHADRLGLGPGDRVFVPLTGKTRDVSWWLSQGHRVVGAELNEGAVRELFAELDRDPEVTDSGPLQRFEAGGLVVFVGDVFDVTAERLGDVAAVYDRAALVALPPDLRDRYAAHVTSITDAAPQLVLCFEYEPSQADGPPFSIDEDEIERCYGDAYAFELLDVRDRALRGVPARETAWLLRS